MKKLFLILTLCFVVLLASCGTKDKNETKDTDNGSQQQTTTQTSAQTTGGEKETEKTPVDNESVNTGHSGADLPELPSVETESGEVAQTSNKAPEITAQPTPETTVGTQQSGVTVEITFPYTNREPIELPEV